MFEILYLHSLTSFFFSISYTLKTHGKKIGPHIKGGGIRKVHVVFRGGYPNVHVCLLGREGGSKMAKNLFTWFVNGP